MGEDDNKNLTEACLFLYSHDYRSFYTRVAHFPTPLPLKAPGDLLSTLVLLHVLTNAVSHMQGLHDEASERFQGKIAELSSSSDV